MNVLDALHFKHIRRISIILLLISVIYVFHTCARSRFLCHFHSTKVNNEFDKIIIKLEDVKIWINRIIKKMMIKFGTTKYPLVCSNIPKMRMSLSRVLRKYQPHFSFIGEYQNIHVVIYHSNRKILPAIGDDIEKLSSFWL